MTNRDLLVMLVNSMINIRVNIIPKHANWCYDDAILNLAQRLDLRYRHAESDMVNHLRRGGTP